jgi:thiol:disulfide interchange protein DsbC
LNNRIHIFYTGAAGDFLLMGQLYDSGSGRNLTRETLEQVNLFSPEEMSQLTELSAVTLGSAGKIILYATDPHCPYCKQGEETLKRLAAAGELTAKILFFPLDSYKDSRDISIATICDKKSLDDFHGGYKSNNQCPEGVRAVETTKAILSRKGVTGTPTYIFPDRRYHSGLLEEAELRRRLGLPSAELLLENGFSKVKFVEHGFQGDVRREGPQRGQRTLNGWQNSGLPWSNRINPEKIYRPSR